MTVDDLTDNTATAPPGARSPVSRRLLLKSAAGVGVAAAAAGIGIAHADTTAPTRRPATSSGAALTPAAAAAPPATDAAGAMVGSSVVVHLVDRASGALEVFATGTRRAVRDRSLASAIGQLGGQAPVVVHLVDPAAGAFDVYSAGAHTAVRNPALARRIANA